LFYHHFSIVIFCNKNSRVHFNQGFTTFKTSLDKHLEDALLASY